MHGAACRTAWWCAPRRGATRLEGGKKERPGEEGDSVARGTVNSPIQCSYHLPHSPSLSVPRRGRVRPTSFSPCSFARRRWWWCCHHPLDLPCLTGKLNRYFTVSYPLQAEAARVQPQRGGTSSLRVYPPIALLGKASRARGRERGADVYIHTR